MAIEWRVDAGANLRPNRQPFEPSGKPTAEQSGDYSGPFRQTGRRCMVHRWASSSSATCHQECRSPFLPAALAPSVDIASLTAGFFDADIIRVARGAPG